jgi:hypothetical protein
VVDGESGRHDAIDPGLQRARRAEVVEGHADHDLVRGQHLADKRLGQRSSFALLSRPVLVGHEVRGERVQIEMRNGISGQIAVDHEPVGLGPLPVPREMVRQRATARPCGPHRAIDMKQRWHPIDPLW